MVADFVWPTEIACQGLDNFIDNSVVEPTVLTSNTCQSNLQEALTKIRNVWQKDPKRSKFIVDIQSSINRGPHLMEGVCPCLTRSRAANKGFWLVWKERFTTIDEILKLSGIPNGRIPKKIAPDRALGAIAGNSVTVPLLARALQAMLAAVRL